MHFAAHGLKAVVTPVRKQVNHDVFFLRSSKVGESVPRLVSVVPGGWG